MGVTTNYVHVCDPALAAVVAWLVLVITLEANDFRHHLHLAHRLPTLARPSHPHIPHHRYVASLVAIRLGLRDALVDAAILYALGYAVVIGFTYGDADPNSLFILWGFSAMVSACLLGIAGLKVPQWLGYYRRSNLQLLKDVSGRASTAVRDLTEGGVGVVDFRYQARLGVGRHAAQFVFFLLPFYTDLKVYAFFVSILVGLLFGHLYLFIVYWFRQRFSDRLAQVAIGSAIALAAVSALVFVEGMYIINTLWHWDLKVDGWVISLTSWLGWLGLSLFLQLIQYCEQRKLAARESAEGEEEDGEGDDDEAHLFIEDDDITDERDTISSLTAGGGSRTAIERESILGGEKQSRIGTEASPRDELEEPLMGSEESGGIMPQRESMATSGYFYQIGYFDRVTLVGKRSKKEPAALLESMNNAAGGGIEDSTPREIYEAFASLEQSGKKTRWYHRLWQFLPFQSGWALFKDSCATTWSCCKKNSKFYAQTRCQKIWHVLIKTSKLIIDMLAIYAALVACAATTQIRITKSKLPFVREVLYAHQNEGPVCAFDEKCGDIQDFGGREEAHLANYSVAHCGKCGYCSTWNDLELQYSTRHNLAEMAQECGMKTMFQGIDGLQQCLETDIGWTSNCARCWAEDIYCTKRWCIFIYLQSRMTNQLGNFEVDPNSITSATCEEANCEAGNPGHFVQCSGSNRRRMNITSDIARPPDEQCQIVDVADWGTFFNPEC
ncbi:hypothetical protein ACHAXT_006490 [Thalassiosira profunda]